MSKYERIDFKELKKMLIERIPVVEVHERYSGFVDKKSTMSRCPFCGKLKFFETSHNGFRCFGECGNNEKINIFSYYMKKFNVDFFEAEINLAKDFGFISVETAERILSKRNPSKTVTINKVVFENRPVIKDIHAKRQSDEVISNVYESISKISLLKKEQFYYLKNIRGLSLDRILNDYFNMPYMVGDAGISFMNKLKSYINKTFGYNEDVLLGVPGFYLDDNNNITFICRKGIGMKARNATGLINGIQIRNYDSIQKNGDLYIKNKDYKYLWVSSRDKEKGCSMKAAIDVIVPKGNIYSSLFITEGKFKSEIISKQFSTPTISVQGVTQWRGVLENEIKYIKDNITDIKNIYVCFDADMGTNLMVYNELDNMCKEVLGKYSDNIKLAIWDESFGKGLDDVILSNNLSKIKKVLLSDYCSIYKKFLEVVKTNYEIRGVDIYYKKTNNKVEKYKILKLYKEFVLKALDVEIKIEQEDEKEWVL